MKCPLFTAAEIGHEPELKPAANGCLKEECAWWDSVGQRCVSLSIYQELRLLVGAISMLADKIPSRR